MTEKIQDLHIDCRIHGCKKLESPSDPGGSIPSNEHGALITMFINFIQTKGLWPCVMESGEQPKPIPPSELLKLKDEFVGRN
ncbi:MAG: hypothetical protein AB2761_20160 [Candidatus Thiodiazotropha endolucinida]